MNFEDRYLIDEARDFLESYRVRDVTDKTIELRAMQLEQFSKWLDDTGRSVKDCDFEDIEAYIGYLKREKGYAHKTVHGYFSAVSILYDRLYKKNELDEDPFDKLTLSDYITYNKSRQAKELKENGEVIFLSKSEIRELTNHVPAPKLRNRLIIQFLFQTGVRRQEARDIKLNDLDREERTVKIRGKGDKNRTVYYDKKLDLLLDSWLDLGYRSSSLYASESDYLFLAQNKPNISETTIGRIVKQAAENAGIQETVYEDSVGRPRRKVTAHSLRHSFAVHYLRQGGRIERLKEIMGHSTVQTTEQYAEVIDEDVKEEYRQLDIGNRLGSQAAVDRCAMCNEEKNLQSHHLSYDPPETIDVCTSCHTEIHQSNKHLDLLPDRSR